MAASAAYVRRSSRGVEVSVDGVVQELALSGRVSRVASMRWDPAGRRVILAGVPDDGRLPDVRGHAKGDLFLHEWRFETGEHRVVYRGYANDPVVVAGGLAAHRGAGLVFVDEDGAVTRECKVGRFDWGPPSLAASPDSAVVAWIRWRNDARRLCVETPSGDLSQEFKISVYNYAWVGDRSIAYYLGGGMRTVDVTTGRHAPLFDPRRALIGAELTDQVIPFFHLPPRRFTAALEFGHLRRVGDRLWFIGRFIHQMPEDLEGHSALFSCNLDGTGWRLEAEHLTTENKIDDYTVHPDGSLTLHFVERHITEWRGAHTEHRGPSAGFLQDGWSLLPDSSMPEFGFHELPV